jgi:hypothetical protein
MSFGLEIKLNQASFSFVGVRRSAVLASWGSITGTGYESDKGVNNRVHDREYSRLYTSTTLNIVRDGNSFFHTLIRFAISRTVSSSDKGSRSRFMKPRT